MASLKRCSGFIELSRLGNFLITPRKITRNSQPPRRVREILWASSTGIHHQFQFSFTHVDNICHANCRMYLAPSEKFPGSANVHRELHAPLRQPLRNLWNSVLGTAADLSRTLSLLPLSFKEKLYFERDERRVPCYLRTIFMVNRSACDARWLPKIFALWCISNFEINSGIILPNRC